MIHLPVEGIGIRVMGCENYDQCLYEAAIKDWDSFNCEKCDCRHSQQFDFFDSEYTPEFESLDLEFEDDLKVEFVSSELIPFGISEHSFNFNLEEFISDGFI